MGRGLYQKFRRAMHLDSTVVPFLRRELAGASTVLDIGCGRNSPVAKVDSNAYSVGIDLYLPALRESKAKRIHSDHVLADAMHLPLQQTRVFDVAVMIEVVEHLYKEEGVRLMLMLANLARKLVMSTPNGFMAQDAEDGNVYQIHHSGWRIRELREMGFAVYGVEGLKGLRAINRTFSRHSWRMLSKLVFLLQDITHWATCHFPYLADGLFAVMANTDPMAYSIRSFRAHGDVQR